MNKYIFYPLTSYFSFCYIFHTSCMQNEIGIKKPTKLSVCGELEKDNKKFMLTLEALISPRLMWRSQ